MPTLVGIILLALGVLLLLAGAVDFAKHGGFYMKARPVGHVAGTGQTVFFLVMFTSMVLGGFYLLLPSTTCGIAALP